MRSSPDEQDEEWFSRPQFTCMMQVPLRHTSGAQHSLLVVHAPHVPWTHAWLLQSRHDPQPAPPDDEPPDDPPDDDPPVPPPGSGGHSMDAPKTLSS